MNTKLWYQSPAASFSEALPIGNGSLGAVIYGTLPEESVFINQDTLWSGTGNREKGGVDRALLNKAKKLSLAGSYYEAQQLVEEHMLGDYNESYMPLGVVKYSFPQVKEYNNYRRELDLGQALLKTEFVSGDVRYQSEIFSSYPDNVIAIKIRSGEANKLDVIFNFESRLQYFSAIHEGNGIVISGNAPSHVEPNYVPSHHPVVYEKTDLGMPFCGYLRVENQDGGLYIEEGKLHVMHATEVIAYITVSDGYEGFQKPISYSHKACFEKCRLLMEQISGISYALVKERHLSDYTHIFKRVYFDLGEPEPEVPTDERLRKLKSGEEDKGLYCLYFHYNRYLMIASSRIGSQPSNLQGIWSDSTRPVWSSNWTININTEMNYWPVGSCNMLECYDPLIRMLEEMSIAGQETAVRFYGCRGWAANHNVDLWRQTEPVDGMAKYAYWPMGGVWLSAQIYDYYKYTRDKKILENRIYPVMRGAACFCLDWLVKREDGYYYTPLSTSPENTFYDCEKRECAVSFGSTMDTALIRELFKNVVEASEILDISDDFTEEVKEKYGLLPAYKVGREGQLQEWAEDFEEKDPGHRHFSPLAAFHPGTTINKYDTPELIKSVEKFIEHRLENGGGHIGWSCAWLINFYARLGNGEEALHYLKRLLTNSSYDNLFDLHPPLGESEGEREVFQIDGNFGSLNGMSEMLLQSCYGIIELLPALPKAWPKGEVTGLLAEGGITVDLKWKDGVLKEAGFLSAATQEVSVKYRDVQWQLYLQAGKKAYASVPLG